MLRMGQPLPSLTLRFSISVPSAPRLSQWLGLYILYESMKQRLLTLSENCVGWTLTHRLLNFEKHCSQMRCFTPRKHQNRLRRGRCSPPRWWSLRCFQGLRSRLGVIVPPQLLQLFGLVVCGQTIACLRYILFVKHISNILVYKLVGTSSWYTAYQEHGFVFKVSASKSR